MSSQLDQLLAAIVSYTVEHGSYVTKTKLLKLLYLFDVEYYRIHRRTFTGFQWRFLHLGPWTGEFEPVLTAAVTRGVVREEPSSQPDSEAVFYKPTDIVDVGEVFSEFSDEAVLRSLLRIWATRATGEILDYVYFRTPPMEHGIRNEPLDFSHIPEECPPAYTRSSSGVTEREIHARRERFRRELAERGAAQRGFSFTPPRYDAEFFEALSRLERSAG